MTRRPVFIVGTEGTPPEPMKADARRALLTFQAAREDDSLPFLAVIDGAEPRRFLSLPDAMTYAEGVDGASGTVTCLGLAVVRYHHGAVGLADEFSTRFPTADPTTEAL